ncbi:MAG: 2-phospho-L-lactate transferase CofD family protein, partial [Bacillota bacterium]|nr:2-phospho-L-lactate transferase CofD family protein [Bacillota bacterium]
MQLRDFMLGLVLGVAGFLIPRLRRNRAVHDEQIWEALYEKYCGDDGPLVTAIGGGTGLSTLLRGLKKYTSNLSAIVNVTDDGGSSGRLRENLDMLPPGDIRNCLLALANT